MTIRAHASASDAGSWCFSWSFRCRQTSGSLVGYRPQVRRASCMEQTNGNSGVGERGRIRHVVPGDAVDVREDNMRARGTQQLDPSLDNLQVLDAHQGDRAGTIGTVVGGL